MTGLVVILTAFTLVAIAWIAHKLWLNQQRLDKIEDRVADVEKWQIEHERRIRNLEWSPWPNESQGDYDHKEN